MKNSQKGSVPTAAVQVSAAQLGADIVSDLYWNALATSERGVKEFEARHRNAPKRAAQKEKRTLSPEQAAQLQAAREEAARQAEAERLRECATAASKVLELVGSL